MNETGVWIDPYELVPGKSYRIEFDATRNRLPLVLDPEPVDPLAAIAFHRYLSFGIVLTIMDRRKVRAAEWYRVRLPDGRIGYVIVEALIGKDISEVK